MLETGYFFIDMRLKLTKNCLPISNKYKTNFELLINLDNKKNKIINI